MSSTDPRELVDAIEWLSAELRRWEIQAGELARSAEHRQRLALEAVRRGLRSAAIARDDAQVDVELVERATDEMERIRHLGEVALSQARTVRSTCVEQQAAARAALDHWTHQLAEARAWLARALARVARAEAALAAAQSQLADAEAELRRAEVALRWCESSGDVDENGRRQMPNCFVEAAAVSRARGEVRRAEVLVIAAQEELESARREEARARARVACCEQAVEWAEQGHEAALLALREAGRAVATAERGLESVAAAAGWLDEAVEINHQSAEATDACTVEAQVAEQRSSEADRHHRQARDEERDARRLARLFRPEAAAKVQALHLLDRPDPALESVGSGWVQRDARS